jgi:outer membrane protein OmpA-like peptidoglycan-associated protein
VLAATAQASYTIRTVAGTGVAGYSGDGTASTTQLNDPTVVVQRPGNPTAIYIADTGNCRVRLLSMATGQLTTVAGTGVCGYSGDGGPATAAQLNYPVGLEFLPDGRLLIADSYNCRIRSVSPSGVISTFAGTGNCASSGDGGQATGAQLGYPTSLEYTTDNRLHFWEGHTTDRTNANCRARVIDLATGVVSWEADANWGWGTAQCSFAPLSPFTLMSDQWHRNVRYSTSATTYGVTPPDGTGPQCSVVASPDSGPTTTIAGNGACGYGGDGGPAEQAQFNRPLSITGDGYGDLLVADTGNNRIRLIQLGAGPPTTPTPPPTTGGANCTRPRLTSLSPASGSFGDRVVIIGTDLGTSGTVTFNGVKALTEQWSATSVIAFVPPMANTGPVVVQCPTASNALTFTITAASDLAPFANAVVLPTRSYRAFAFDGRLSADPDGTITGWTWTLNGRVVSHKSVFTHHFPTRSGRYRLLLIVTDDQGTKSPALPVPARVTKPSTRHPKPPVKNAVALPNDLLFGFDSCAVSPAGKRYLARLRPLVRGAISLSLAGRADWTGPTAYNQRLSLCRANAVKRILLAHSRPRPRRVTAVGLGETHPLAPNTTAAGRARNRSVSLTVVRKG